GERGGGGRGGRRCVVRVGEVSASRGGGRGGRGGGGGGIVKVGDEVEIVGIHPTRKTVVTGVEMFRKLLDEGQAGDNIGALLRGVDKDEVERGQVVAKTGAITPHKRVKAEGYGLAEDRGRRH